MEFVKREFNRQTMGNDCQQQPEIQCPASYCDAPNFRLSVVTLDHQESGGERKWDTSNKNQYLLIVYFFSMSLSSSFT